MASGDGPTKSLGDRLKPRAAVIGAVFRNPHLRSLELSAGANWIGEQAYLVALFVYAYNVGGAPAVGLVGVVRMLPAAILALFGSIVVDRVRRHRLLQAVFLFRAAAACGSAVAVSADGPAALVFALGGLVFLVSAMVRPSQWALMPTLARTPEELTAANVAAAMIEGTASLLGPAVAGVLLALASTGSVFVAAAVGFAAAFGCAKLLDRADLPPPIPLRRQRPVGELAAGLRALRQHRDSGFIVALSGSQTLVRGAFNVLVVVASIELLRMGESGVGTLNAAFGAGNLLGAVATVALVGRRSLARPFGIGLVLWGAPIALVAFWPAVAPAIVLLAIPGIGNALVDVTVLTLLQRLTPDQVIGRVFGVLEAWVMGTIAIGGVIAGGLVAWAGVRGAMIATGLLLPVLTGIAWARLRAIDGRTTVPVRELELLGGIRVFAALPPVALERIAGRLVPVTIPTGQTVIRQGDAGDRFYLIADGKVEVSASGRVVNTLGPGEFFGEIALLREVPRTATVTALSDVELLALERDDFVRAVTANRETFATADAAIQARLEALEG